MGRLIFYRVLKIRPVFLTGRKAKSAALSHNRCRYAQWILFCPPINVE